MFSKMVLGMILGKIIASDCLNLKWYRSDIFGLVQYGLLKILILQHEFNKYIFKKVRMLYMIRISRTQFIIVYYK